MVPIHFDEYLILCLRDLVLIKENFFIYSAPDLMVERVFFYLSMYANYNVLLVILIC